MKPKKRRVNKSRWIRETILSAATGKEQLLGFGHRRISYRIMTDHEGVKWDVPVTDDLILHDPKRWEDLASQTWEKCKLP